MNAPLDTGLKRKIHVRTQYCNILILVFALYHDLLILISVFFLDRASSCSFTLGVGQQRHTSFGLFYDQSRSMGRPQ